MGHWTFDGPNPIVGYTVSIELAQPLTSPLVRHIATLHNQFRRELPRRLDQQAVTFQMGAPSARPLTPAVSGVVFDSLRPDGTPSKALIANQNVISVMIAQYTRWIEFWPMAERLLMAVGRPALAETEARALFLSAHNRFEWISSEHEDRVAISHLVRREAKYIAPYILGCHGQCHSFIGYTESHEAPPGMRTDNVLLTLTTPEDRQVLDLNFNLRLELAEMKSGEELFGHSAEGSFLESTLDTLHRLNKKLMCDTLLESVAKEIPGLC